MLTYRRGGEGSTLVARALELDSYQSSNFYTFFIFQKKGVLKNFFGTPSCCSIIR
jgi:hypothetical protein